MLMQRVLLTALVVILCLADDDNMNDKSKRVGVRKGGKGGVMPACEFGASCEGLVCGCCGECNADTDYICRRNDTIDCKKYAYSPPEIQKTQVTDKEKKDGKEFFDLVKKYSNTSYDFDFDK